MPIYSDASEGRYTRMANWNTGGYSISPPINVHFSNITVNNPDIIHKVQKFHRTFATLQNLLCNVCLEQFPCFMTNSAVADMCRHCNFDTHIPKPFFSWKQYGSRSCTFWTLYTFHKSCNTQLTYILKIQTQEHRTVIFEP